MKSNVIRRSFFDKSRLKVPYSIFRTALKNVMLVFLILFILVSILLLFSVVEFNLNKDSKISNNPLFSAYVIVTESMVPTINVNDGIIVKRVDNKDIGVGDIITFTSSDDRYSGLTITHRVVNKERVADGKYLYITKGDNNIVVDPGTINLENIYGKVLFKIPKIGYVQKFVSSPLGFVLSIVIPIIIVILYEIYRVMNAIQKRNKELMNL